MSREKPQCVNQTEEDLLQFCLDSFKSSNDAVIAFVREALDSPFHHKSNLVHAYESSKQKNTCTNNRLTLKKFITIFARLMNMLLLDLPLLMICTLLLATFSAQYLYSAYWNPIMDHLTWTSEKRDSRHTYYMRECDTSDILPQTPDELFLDPDLSSPMEAANTVMRYGGAVFPKILSADTMRKMRDFVLHQNGNLNDDIEIPLLSQDMRWSFAIGGDMDPSVPPVLREIATNVFLQSSLDLLLGKDPAMVEFTAITSAYGAGDQHWHADSLFLSSYMHYARSFVPYYSLFIPLQDTSSAMGATSVCPGTHFCGKENNLAEICQELGFQVSDTEDGVWKAGDGFLMHLNVYHRGPAYIDPDGTERVMLIMSIAPRPVGHTLETRQLGLGTSYSQRWDMWSLTMKDLVDIKSAMWWPRKILRTFGIYKGRRGADDSDAVKWGWDYITIACSRIVNNQMGFRYNDLKTFVRKIRRWGILADIIFGHLPILDVEATSGGERKYTQDDDVVLTGWREYIQVTLKRLSIASSCLYGMYLLFYLAVASLAHRQGVASGVFCSLTIAALLNGLVLIHVANSPWGRGAKSLSSNSNPFPMSTSFDRAKVHSKYIENRLTTLPSQTDVFLSSRLDSHEFHAHNSIYDFQPGNQLWYSLIADASRIFQGAELSSSMRLDITRDVVKRVKKTGARFIHQNHDGNWEILSLPDTELLTDIYIQADGNQIYKKVHEEIKFSKSTCRHGEHRNTVMASSFCVTQLNDLIRALFSSSYYTEHKDKVSSEVSTFRIVPFISISTPLISIKIERNSNENFDLEDVVEGWFNEGWFRGRVIDFDDDDTYIVKYDDGNVNGNQAILRKFIPYESGEAIEAYYDGLTRGTIHTINSDSTVSIISDEGLLLERIPISRIYRSTVI